MIKVYGKPNCDNCIKIKNLLDEKGKNFEYIDNEKETTNKALELRKEGRLIEMTAPLVIIDGVQVKHADLK